MISSVVSMDYKTRRVNLLLVSVSDSVGGAGTRVAHGPTLGAFEKSGLAARAVRLN